MPIEDTIPQATKEEGRQIVRETPIVGIPSSLAQTLELAKVMAASGLYPDFATSQKASGAIIIGAQYGLSPAQSLGSVHIVKGKPMLHYSLILAKVREHPDYDYRIVESNDERAEVEFLRHDSVCGREVFTVAQAKRQGTGAPTQNSEGMLAKFPDTMLLARAVSKGVKKYCPDVLNGMPTYVQGEIDEVDAGFGKHATKGDQLREEMQRRASEIACSDVVDAEFKDVTNDPPANPLEPFGLTEAQVHDFRVYAEANGMDLEAVAAKCSEKTAVALARAIEVTQGDLGF
ncbi:MAG: hypothetical protein JST12_14565 [Armatimonadetes bacterium]|nr:hypothetical protein [Armatimonadota bacterium]